MAPEIWPNLAQRFYRISTNGPCEVPCQLDGVCSNLPSSSVSSGQVYLYIYIHIHVRIHIYIYMGVYIHIHIEPTLGYLGPQFGAPVYETQDPRPGGP